MKRFVAVCLVFGLIICMLGCMASNKEMDSGVEAQATRIITDVWNREVEIPLKVGPQICGLPRCGRYDGGSRRF